MVITHHCDDCGEEINPETGYCTEHPAAKVDSVLTDDAEQTDLPTWEDWHDLQQVHWGEPLHGDTGLVDIGRYAFRWLVSGKPVNDREAYLCIPDYTTGSDYSGCLVHRSNYEVFCEQFANGVAKASNAGSAWWTTAHGGHSTFAIVIDVRSAPREALEFLSALEDYPVADHSHHSELEFKAECEAWENWGEREFVRAIEKKLGCDFGELDPAKVLEVFEEAREAANLYWENEEGPSVWIDVERIAAKVTAEDVADWPKEES